MKELTPIEEAWRDCLLAVKRAEEAGKVYIAVQGIWRYRLVAVGSSYRGEVCSRVEPLKAWAENILYRLCYRLFLDGDYDDLDRFLDSPAAQKMVDRILGGGG